MTKTPFASLQELKAVQKTIADASVAIGQAMVAADAAYSKPWFGPGRRMYETAQDEKRLIMQWFDIAKEFVTKGTISGRTATKEEAAALLRLGSSEINNYAGALKDSMEFAPSAIAGRALGAVATRLFGIGDDLAKAAESILKGAATALQWLPIALAVIVIGPLLLKTFSGYKSGGARGAADAASGELERARSTIARKAGISGLRRRRRSR